MDKLFLVTRRDLPPGVRAAQLCHAMRQWSHEYPEEDREWFERSNTVALLETSDEGALEALARRAHEEGVQCVEVREPDLGDALTAVTIGPRGRRLVGQLPLALKEGQKGGLAACR